MESLNCYGGCSRIIRFYFSFVLSCDHERVFSADEIVGETGASSNKI